jgi:hypothetical protein
MNFIFQNIQSHWTLAKLRVYRLESLSKMDHHHLKVFLYHPLVGTTPTSQLGWITNHLQKPWRLVDQRKFCVPYDLYED